MTMPDARNLYRESIVCGARPVQLVVMLYEQMVEDLRRAVKAIEEKRIDARTNAINHAILILGHLQNKLNHEAGGEVARSLERFYNLLRQKLVEAQFTGVKEILNQQLSLLLELRDAWTEADRAEAARLASAAAPPPREVSHDTIGQELHADWKG